MDIGNIRCPSCNKSMVPRSCRCPECGLEMKGDFSISPLALLPPQDQALAIAFIRSFGSIKKIQEILEVSYPTARSRLEHLIERLNILMEAPPDAEEILASLEKGEISFDEAMEKL